MAVDSLAFGGNAAASQAGDAEDAHVVPVRVRGALAWDVFWPDGREERVWLTFEPVDGLSEEEKRPARRPELRNGVVPDKSGV